MTVAPTPVRAAARAVTTPRLLLAFLLALLPAARAAAQGDVRATLRGGIFDAGEAAKNVRLVANRHRPDTFVDKEQFIHPGYVNSDLAFQGHLVFQGNYHGFQVWDITDPASPVLRKAYECAGGQGDPSVYGNLLFFSVQETLGRLDCGAQGVQDTVSSERFRGVRIFDISDLDHPRQVAAIQACRGSHTNTIVPDPADPSAIYVYVSGTSVIRSGSELRGCSDKPAQEDPNTSRFKIDIIRVPLAAPQEATIIASPRLFADSTGFIAGLWKGGSHGEGTQATSETDQCHDITVYQDKGLAAGACAGNGILIDIRDPKNPKRLSEVTDPNFAYFHSATFNNDATTVLFTDEWGGGSAPKCRASDPPKWGADAIYSVSQGRMTEGGFYKLPSAQSSEENCVAHNGSLIPIPGRDVMAQAWYQGGLSLVDFSEPAHAYEIGYFDRGPVNPAKLQNAGYWSTYWYNGYIYGSEEARGLDVLELVAGPELSQNEIDAAKLVQLTQFNPQLQPTITWPAKAVVARAYLDQLTRNAGLGGKEKEVARKLEEAERQGGSARGAALLKLAAEVERAGRKTTGIDAVRAQGLVTTLTRMAAGS